VNGNGDEQRPPEEEEESFEGGALMQLPAFQVGGRVDRTGIALVHEGEWIMPAPGSDALVAPLPDEAPQGQVVTYHFPVEVEMVAQLSDAQRRSVANHVYDELDAALRARG
jgi:hypothetical protein